MYGIVGVAIDHDVQRTLLISSVIFGIMLVILALTGILIINRRYWPLHWIFTIVLLLTFLFYASIGSALAYMGAYLSNELKGLCEDGKTESDLQQALDELYMRSNAIFCTLPPAGCICYLDHDPEGGERPGDTYISEPAPTIRKVQECDGQLLAIYEGYSIDLYDLSDVIGYLNYFGEIEDEYNCAGICDYQSVYYFSNSEAGAPDKRCYEPFHDEVVQKEILGHGISFLVIGVILGIIF